MNDGKMVDKRIKFLPTGEIKFKGIIFPGETARNDNIIFDKEKWFKHWEKLIEEIKEIKLDSNQINDIHDEFKVDLMLYSFTEQLIKEHQRINELGARLRIVLHRCYSNYRDSQKFFWGFISGLFADKTLEKLDINRILKIKK
ncbi:MAG: hypothetical protein AABX88_01955 [Nanoarchaeota archaeon]